MALAASAVAVAGVGGAQAQTAADVTAALGTVETVAGPGFCVGDGALDPASTGVGAMAVDVKGTLHVDSGAPAEGKVARVDVMGAVSVLRTRPRSQPTSKLTPTGLPAGAEAAGRLAAEPTGGVFVATGRGVLRITPETGETLTGEPTVEDPAPGTASSGDGGPGRDARFRRIVSLATDANGSLYIADRRDGAGPEMRVRFLNRAADPAVFYPGTPDAVTVAPGSIDTVAGGSPRLDGADGAPAASASLAGAGVAMAVSGDRLYLGLSSGRGVDRPSTVRVLNLGGTTLSAHGISVAPATVRTVAGGATGLRGDGGPAVAAALSTTGGVTADDAGNLYVADEGNHRVRRIDPAGTITTHAGVSAPGSGGGGFNGNERPATTARLNRPVDVDAGPGGRLYISDRGNDQVRYVDAAGVIKAAPGRGITASWTCGDEEGAPAADRPVAGALEGVAADTDGSIYFTTNALDQVKRLDASGRITTAAGLGPQPTACPPEGCPLPPDGGLATLVPLRRPAALAVRPGMVGGLYVVERGAARVRFVNLGRRSVRVNGVTVVAGTVRTVAGNTTIGEDGDGGPALDAQLSSAPGAVVADVAGNLFIADGRRIRRVDPEGVITTVIGRERPVPDAPVPAPGALPPCCGTITGLALAPGGGLYVADSRAYVIWAANPGAGPLEVRGRQLAPGAAEPVAGTGHSGFEGDGGPAIDATLVPRGIAVDAAGTIFAGQVVGAPRTLVDAQRNVIRDEKGRPRVAGDTDVTIDHSVRRVGTDGIITTVAGAGTSGFNGDGLSGRATRVFVPTAVAVDRCGNLLIADRDNDRIRRLRLTDACAAPLVATAETDFVVPPWLVALVPVLGALALLAARRRRR